MRNERTVTLNDKGVLLIGVVILSLTFALGFMTANKQRGKDVTIFTEEDLSRIIKMQEMEENEGKSGAEIYAYKDENGNLMIGWDYSSKKK